MKRDEVLRYLLLERLDIAMTELQKKKPTAESFTWYEYQVRADRCRSDGVWVQDGAIWPTTGSYFSYGQAKAMVSQAVQLPAYYRNFVIYDREVGEREWSLYSIEYDLEDE